MSIIDSMFTINNTDIEYLEKILLDDNGELKIIPYSQLKDVPQNDMCLFCVRHGLYNIPTQEQVDFLQEEIGDKVSQTIEIGSGNGVLANALSIKATDSYMQADGAIKDLYKAFKQPPVPYGSNVQRIDGERAVSLYKPKIVIAAWVTHIYNPQEHWREGNMYGVDEVKLFKKVIKYIHIGNEFTHGKKPILRFPHKEIKAPWLISRSMKPDKNVIWIWEK